MFIFETFSVYQLAKKLYEEVLVVIRKRKLDYAVNDQLQRALLSIMLNIAEGSGKYTRKEKRCFYLIARGSCHESAALMKILPFHGIELSQVNCWYQDLVTIGKMLTGMIKALGTKEL